MASPPQTLRTNAAARYQRSRSRWGVRRPYHCHFFGSDGCWKSAGLSARLAEFRQVRTRGQIDPNAGMGAVRFIKAEQTLPNVVRRYPHNRVRRRVVNQRPSEYFNSQDSLFDLVEIAAQRFLHHVSKKFLASPAALKALAREDLLEMFAYSVGVGAKLDDPGDRRLVLDLGTHESVRQSSPANCRSIS
jgi:hypothetical protein